MCSTSFMNVSEIDPIYECTMLSNWDQWCIKVWCYFTVQNHPQILPIFSTPYPPPHVWMLYLNDPNNLSLFRYPRFAAGRTTNPDRITETRLSRTTYRLHFSITQLRLTSFCAESGINLRCETWASNNPTVDLSPLFLRVYVKFQMLMLSARRGRPLSFRISLISHNKVLNIHMTTFFRWYI